MSLLCGMFVLRSSPGTRLCAADKHVVLVS
jgi:hypothetical protein